MTKNWIKQIVSLCLLLFLTAESITLFGQEREALTPEAVQNAIEGGIAYLRKTQKGGAWEEYPGYDPGTTSLCLLALLSTDLPPNDKTIASGLDYLAKFTPETERQTYPIALQTMVFCQADPIRFQTQIKANAEWLVERQFKTENHYNGGWSYTGLDQSYSIADNSNSQFAVLALYEAQKAGISIPDSVWKSIEEYWKRMQNPDGSWGYRADPRIDPSAEANKNRKKSGTGTGSMTCAGITALIISGNAGTTGASVSGDRINCCTSEEPNENRERIERGLDWLAKNFSVQKNPGTAVNAAAYLYYYLYGLERTGRLTAQRYIGLNDWYREGADYLLHKKGALAQFWKPGGSAEKLNSIATSFALLFLSKGRWPVLISKLKYKTDSSEEWNLHPDDLDHLTSYSEKCWGNRMTWQVIDFEKADADDYIQTPVLSISGRLSPLPAAPEERKRLAQSLRDYLDQGGFILAEAFDGGEAFDTGFRELLREIFPEEEDDLLALLPEDHPIWRMEKGIQPEYLRPLYGVDLGCRTSVVYIPPPEKKNGNALPSLSCLWELADELKRGPEYLDSVQKQIDAGLDLGVNILAYATDRKMKYKEEIPQELEKPVDEHHDFYAGILNLGNGSPCAPRAIPKLVSKIKTEMKIPIRSEVNLVRLDSPDLGTYPILFLHGRNAFTLTDEEVAVLRDYFDWGGFVFANAVCAGRQFTISFANEMKKVFPDSELVQIPAGDPLYSDFYGGTAIEKLEMRRTVIQNGEKKGRKTVTESPRLFGIKKEGRWVVVFSPFDVSCALEGNASSQCEGYTPESAWRIALNVVLYAAEHLE